MRFGLHWPPSKPDGQSDGSHSSSSRNSVVVVVVVTQGEWPVGQSCVPGKKSLQTGLPVSSLHGPCATGQVAFGQFSAAWPATALAKKKGTNANAKQTAVERGGGRKNDGPRMLTVHLRRACCALPQLCAAPSVRGTERGAERRRRCCGHGHVKSPGAMRYRDLFRTRGEHKKKQEPSLCFPSWTVLVCVCGGRRSRRNLQRGAVQRVQVQPHSVRTGKVSVRTITNNPQPQLKIFGRKKFELATQKKSRVKPLGKMSSSFLGGISFLRVRCKRGRRSGRVKALKNPLRGRK